MSQYEARNFDDLFYSVVSDLRWNPEFVCSPRGQKVNESLVVQLQLDDPRRRLLHCQARQANYGFAAGEFLWYWAAKNDLETMLYYNKRMKDFSDDGLTLNSAYGAIMRGRASSGDIVLQGVGDQWKGVIRTLQSDPDSRRAIVQIHHPAHQLIASTVGTKDVPCTLSLQFFVRNGRLDMHASMRSNDVIWGLTYDLFSFTLLQECMVHELRRAGIEVELGRYFHTAGSMHLYERHFEQASQICAEYEDRLVHDECDLGAPPMAKLTSLDMLQDLVEDEHLLRVGDIAQIDLERYSGAERFLAEQLNVHRLKRDAERKRS